MDTKYTLKENETIRLYHGSKSGIIGNILPKSREHCDFGKGFYMGSEKIQPLTLICNFPKSRLYTLRMNMKGLNILEIEAGIDWALFVAFHREKMESIKGTSLYNKYSNMSNGYDMIIGPIANDRMFVVLDRFFSGEITDTALVHSLSALNLGKQYVAINEKACCQIHIENETNITNDERKELILLSEHNRNEGISRAEEICKKYRRDGRFFDEILSEGN